MRDALTIVWNNTNAKDWQALYVQAVGAAALQQSDGYAQMAQAMGARITRAVLYKNGAPIALWQATQKQLWRLYTITLGMRGPVWLCALSDEEKMQCLAIIRADMRNHWRRHCLFMPEEAEGFAPTMRQLMTGYSTGLLNLQQNEEALLSAQQGKWRNRLRAAEKSGLRVDVIGQKPENYAWLLAEETEQRKRIGYAALSPLAVPLYQQYAGKDGVLGLQAWLGNQRVAGMLFLRHGHSATYHIGWSSDEGKKASAHNLLLWEAIKRLKASGTQWLDVGGVNDDDGAGLTRFKLGSGAALLKLCGTYR